MFGELSAMTWLGGAIILAIGGGAGFFTARQIKDKRTLKLEQQLDAAQNQLTGYQDDVNRHFLKTSLLFNKLTDDYREVYEHLATGAQKLCNEKTRITALDLPEAKILSAAVAIDASTAITAEEKAETDTVSATLVEAARDDTAQPGAENIVAAENPSTENLSTENLSAENLNIENTEATNTQTAHSENTDSSEHAVTEQVVTEPLVVGPAVEKQATEEQTVTEHVAAEQTTKQATETLTSENAATEPTEAKTIITETITAETKTTEGRPTISAKELKILEANEKKKNEEEEIHLGAESTPGVELEHHKTHPSIH